jgi:hypothetical protein
MESIYEHQKESWVNSVMRTFRRKITRNIERPVLQEFREIAKNAYPASHVDDYSLSPDGIGLSRLSGRDSGIVDVFLTSLQSKDRGYIGAYVLEFRQDPRNARAA